MEAIFFAVSILTSFIGSICGIGGGVIIKPVLDATGVISVSAINFLSGCTVLAMSAVSVYKSLKEGTAALDIKQATPLAAGAALGGICGKSIFEKFIRQAGNDNLAGMVQAILLVIITAGTLLYTAQKSHIKTRACRCFGACLLIGILLGILSGFLGIGGGPINLVVLIYFFSMQTKEAALSSLYIIMLSQAASLMRTCLSHTIPEISFSYLLCMVAGGVLGGMIGSKVNKKISDRNGEKLFVFLMIIIIAINLYNAVKFGISAI